MALSGEPDKIFVVSPSAEAIETTEKGPNSDVEHDTDALKLAKMGYTQDMQRNFSVVSLLGVAFSLANSWFGISASMITGISSGGTVLIIYGIPWISLISLCVGASLSELASAMPNSGGQYFWANELAPKQIATFASYLTGWLAWAGAIFTCASVAVSLSQAGVGMWQLTHPDFVVSNWHIVVGYEVINFFAFLFNCVGKILPTVATTTLYISLISFLVILITVPAAAPTHATAKQVFGQFVNDTGWSSDGLAFLVGLINPNWIFACLDSATHLAEEVSEPERSIPIAILCTVLIGFLTSWTYCISLFFSVNDLSALQNTNTGVPVLALFYQAVQSKAGAVVLETLILVTGIGCQIACHTWQSRLCWSFARDGGLPGSRYLSQIHPRLDIPLIAHSVSCFIVGLLGLLNFSSSTAFNSMVTACIVLLYGSYVVPILSLLYRGRNIPHGPFWLGGLGLFCNIVVLAWTLFCLVIYAFPSAYPALASNMNYVCVVYAIVVFIIGIDWVLRGRLRFRSQTARHEQIEANVYGR